MLDAEGNEVQWPFETFHQANASHDLAMIDNTVLTFD
jgi:hypothetical protein